MKACSKCKIPKLVSEFHKQSITRDGLYSSCKKCRGTDQDTRDYKYKTRYGITLEGKREMYLTQDGKCLICRKKMLTAGDCQVDHDHKTGKVRGLLHRSCNLIIGHANDDVKLLQSAIYYLQHSL